VPIHGHALALVGLDGGHFHLFQPVIVEAGRPLAKAVESAITRHFFLLESGCATLHFMTFAPHADAVQTAIAAIAPASTVAASSAELAALDAEVAADRLGLRYLETAGRRAALAAELEAGTGGGDLYPWLDRDVVGVPL
jgi:hypothetical protein